MLRSTLALLAFTVVACASAPEVRHDEQEKSRSRAEEWRPFPQEPKPRPEPSKGAILAAWAERLSGTPSLSELTRNVPDECTGFVRLIYWQAGVELLGPEAHPSDNGVTAIYRHAQARGALHWHRPDPGDLVFFVETYDRNRDGKRNDGLTHIALVESVDPDGTVLIVHRVGGGVKKSRMNLKHPTEMTGPHGERWNEILRPTSKHLRSYVTGELFAAYASADRLLSPYAPPLAMR